MPEWAPGQFARRYAPLAALVAATLVAYGRTLAIPWYFDDLPVIVANSALRDLGARAAGFFAPRGPVDLSYAVDFRLHGLQIRGYHLVNVGLHLANGLLLWSLLRRIFREAPVRQLAVLAIFLLHPIQTQAVNYVVQRYTLAAAFCALAALLAIARWGEETGFAFRTPRARIAYGSALLLGGLAVLCKQNTATLFVVVPLFCLLFVEREWSRGVLVGLLLLPFALVPFVEGVRQLLLPLVTGATLGEVTGILPTSEGVAPVSPLLYFVTQWKVVWLYLRLLVLPYGQALDYGYPVETSVLTPGNVAAAAGLSLLLLAAWRLRRRWPRTAFGIAWFFAFLLVESTLIPLDPVFEHRLYLPMVGFAIVVADRAPRLGGRRGGAVAIVLLSLVLGLLSWRRNTLWLSPSALLTDNVERHPGNARIYAGAANALASEGAGVRARELLQRGFDRGLRHEAMYISLARILIDEGKLAEAVRAGEDGLRHYPADENLLSLTGLAEDLRGDHDRAAAHHLRAIALHPGSAQAHNNLGASLEKQGRWGEAAAAYGRAIELDPLYSIGHFNLGIALLRMGRPADAVEELRAALRLGEGVRALVPLVLIEAERGDRAAAERYLGELERIDPGRALELRGQLGR